MTDIEIFNQVTEITTLDKEQIAKITERLPEYKRGSSIIGHSTSQSSYSLQTMQMISDSPLSRMKQCLAQIDKNTRQYRKHTTKLKRKNLQLKDFKKYRQTFQTNSTGISIPDRINNNIHEYITQRNRNVPRYV